MKILFWLTYGTLALFIGSFINVIALRTPKGESIVYPPSHCPHCNHRLGALDLIPVISFLFLKGKCHYCGEKISNIYPFGELLTFIILLIIPYYSPFSTEWIIIYPFMMMMIAATLSDLKYNIIPNSITYSGIFLFLILRIFIHPLPVWSYFLGSIIGGGIFLLLAILSRGGMGGGDIKLFFLIGLVLGWQNTVLAIFLSSFVGTLIGGTLLLFGVVKRKQFVPFGPFIFIGTLITYFYGNEIWSFYLSYISS